MDYHDGREVAVVGRSNRTVFFLCVLILVALYCAQGTAMADVINGNVELVGSNSDTKVTDASGLSTTTRAQSLLQRYQLYYTDLLFPYVNIRVGSGFDKTVTTVKDPTEETRLTDTAIYPVASLTLSNPFVYTGVGYNKRQETVEVSNAPGLTTVQETKTAFFGLKPEGLPTIDVQLSETHNYDKAHQFTDVQNDLLLVSTRYTYKGLDLAYIVTTNDGKDHIGGVEVTTVTQNGRAGYSDQFFNNRLSVIADYNGFRSTTDTNAGGSTTGLVFFQLFPFTGLSDISDIPTIETLSTNQALIDGNLTASSGINIGQAVSLAGDTRLRHVGLDFVNIASLNTLYVYVDRQLALTIANMFRWDIYISQDNVSWTLYQTGVQAVFNTFSNRFELAFPNVTTRYIKASVRPLPVTAIAPPGTDISNIYITELQAYVSKPASLASGKNELTSELYDANVRAALTKDRSLFYSFYYSQATSNSGNSTSLLSNTLTYNKQFTPVYSGSARLSRDDGRNLSVAKVSYAASASLMAVPIPTLTNSLVFSGRRDETQGLVSTTESVFLYSAANLYQGFDFNISGGLNNATTETGQRTESTLVNAGLSIVPNKYFSMNANHSETQPVQATTVMNRSSSTVGSVAWTPFSTVYFAYSITENKSSNTPHQLIQNYSGSWSPFSNGALNFTFLYSETEQTSGASIFFDRSFTTGIQWRVGPRIELTAAYTVSSSNAPAQSSDATNLSTDLRMSF